MSHYFDYRVNVPPGAGANTAAWSNVEPLLAVAHTNGSIEFYLEEGGRIGKDVKVGSNPVKLAWHPNKPILAAGWEDGSLIVVGSTNFIVNECEHAHSGKITMLAWNETGTRLFSGDANGAVGVWELDSRNRPTNLHLYKANAPAPITHITFAEMKLPVDIDPSLPVPAITSFFCGGEAGVIYFGDDYGNFQESIPRLGSPVNVLEYYRERSRLVIITQALTMAQYQVESDGGVESRMRVKVGMVTTQGIGGSEWVGPGLLATISTDERLVRIWDLATDEHYTLLLNTADKDIQRSDKVSCIAFNPVKSILAAGTLEGKVVMWRHYRSSSSAKSPASPSKSGVSRTSSGITSTWEPLSAKKMSEPIQQVVWNSNSGGNLAVITPETASILTEATLHRRLSKSFAMVQLSNSELAVERLQQPGGGAGGGMAGSRPVIIQATINIRGATVSDDCAVVWNGKRAEVYSISETKATPESAFDTPAISVAIHGKRIFMAVGDQVKVANTQGTVTQTIVFPDVEGRPILVDCNQRYLAVATDAGILKIFDASRDKLKQTHSGRFEDIQTGEIIGEMTSIRVNADGTKLSILSSRQQSGGTTVPDTHVYLYCADSDRVFGFDVGPRRSPAEHSWDSTEAKMLALETSRVRVAEQGKSGAGEEEVKGETQEVADSIEPEVEAMTLFATQEDGFMVQDSFPIEGETLLGLQIPYIYFVTSVSSTASDASRVRRQTLRDFIGLEDADSKTKNALLDFSYHLAQGNMDEAYKAVKLIDNKSVWENMAHMCVKSKRLDVAEVCLGQMGHARGAKAVREAKQEPELEAQVAMVGIQLGLMSDAMRLYQSCGRYDLLNNLYQACGQWEKALSVAKTNDRIHLRTTYYQYARYLESIGETAQAVKYYELADAHRYEVPRMLFESQNFSQLESYISEKRDKALLKWWAQYCESNGNLDKALRYYNLAADAVSLVRVYCYNREFGMAAEIVAESNDPAAAYHLARQHETSGNMGEAMDYYVKAGRYNHAVRLAKESGADSELMQMALQSTKDVMVDAAKYFEDRRMFDKAVQLYQKGGHVGKAMDLCFRAELFEDLKLITEDLGEGTPPEVLSRAGDFFMQHGQFDKAVGLLVAGGRTEEALRLVTTHRVPLTPDLVEKMTPPKDKDASPDQKAKRTEALRELARACKKQGLYHLATKKYTQAGDKLKAMKSLLKSGDTERIIFFAGVSRSRDIYVLAANYLQNLDWHTDAEVMKAIVSFYTKARAYSQLSAFYESAAAVQIDEFRNYEQALDALKEAVKHASRIRDTAEKENRLTTLQGRIGIVEKFVQARQLRSSDPSQMTKLCQQLLELPDVETSIRTGDVYALLIEHYYNARNMEQAYHLIESMRERVPSVAPFLDQGMVETIYKSMGVEIDEDDDDGIEEDIGEEIE